MKKAILRRTLSMMLLLSMLFSVIPHSCVYAEETGAGRDSITDGEAAQAENETGTAKNDADEKSLQNALARLEEGKAFLLSAREWIPEAGSITGENRSDLVWRTTNASMEGCLEVTASDDAVTVRTTAADEATPSAAQVGFNLSGNIEAGDRIFYAFRIKSDAEVKANVMIRPDASNYSAVINAGTAFEGNGEYVLYCGEGTAPYSYDSSEEGRNGAILFQVASQVQEFQIADLYVINLSRNADGTKDEEEVEKLTFDEVMDLYESGEGVLATYPNLSDSGAYDLEWQDPLVEGSDDFTVELVEVEGQEFTEALDARITKLGYSAYGAQIYFNLDHTRPIKQNDTLFFMCKVRGISSETNKEAAFVTANTRIRPDRSTSSNFDFTSSINKDEVEWTQIYGAVAAPADSKADEDGAWVFQLSAAVQELEIADVKVINFGNAYSVNQMPVMSKSYEGMEENAQWRKEAQERIEQIRKQDITVSVEDGSGNPVEGAEIGVEQTRHEFGFGTIVNVDSYAAWEAQDPEKAERYKEWLKLFAHNRAGFENALKSYYVTNEERQELIGEWLDQFEEWDVDVRGHVLVYGRDENLRNVDMNGVSTDMPEKDLFTSGTAEGNAALGTWIDEHIRTYAGKYKGRIYNWDVVNENYYENDWAKRLYGENEWDALVHWFKVAHEADPDARLTYNDYEIFKSKQHRDYHYDLCSYLKENGAPITTVGIQGHVGLLSMYDVISTLEQFSDLGLDIEITEFTCEDNADPEVQAQFTRDFMTAVFSEEAVSSITTWGFYEGCIYEPKAAMVDSNFNLKPNGEAWLDMVYNQWWTSETGTADENGLYQVRAFKGDHAVTVKVGDVEQSFDLTLSDEPVTLSLVYEDGAIKVKDSDKPGDPGTPEDPDKPGDSEEPDDTKKPEDPEEPSGNSQNSADTSNGGENAAAPKSGDSAPVVLCLTMLLFSGAVIVSGIRIKKRGQINKRG